MYAQDIIKRTDDKIIIKIYDKEGRFITKGNWFNDNILDFCLTNRFTKVKMIFVTTEYINFKITDKED